MPKAKMVWLVSLIGGILIFAWPAQAGLLRGTPVTPSGSIQETALVTSSKNLQTPSVRRGRDPSHSLFKESEDEDGGIFVQSPATQFDEEPARSLFEQSDDDGGGGYVVNRTGQVIRRPLLTRPATPTSTDRPGRGPMPSFGWQQKFKPLGEIKPLTALTRLKKRGPEASSSLTPAASSASSDYSPSASDETDRPRGKKSASATLHDRQSEATKPASPQPRGSAEGSIGVVSRSYQSTANPNTTHFITGTPAEVDKFIRQKQREDDQILKEREREGKEQRRLDELAAKNEKKQEESAAKAKVRDVAKEDADMRAKWQEANRRAEKAEAELARKAEESAKQQGTKSSAKLATQKNIPPSDGGRGAVVSPAPAGISSPVAAEIVQRQQQQAEANVRDRQYSESIERFHELNRRGQSADAAGALEQAYANSAYTSADNIKQRMEIIEGLSKTLPTSAVAQNPTLSHIFAPQTQPQPQVQQAVPVQRLTIQQMEEQSRQEREAIAAALRLKAPENIPVNASTATQLLAMANVTYSRPELLMGSGPNVGQTSPMVKAGDGSRAGTTTAKPLMPATYAPSGSVGSKSISASQVAAIKAKEGK